MMEITLSRPARIIVLAVLILALPGTGVCRASFEGPMRFSAFRPCLGFGNVCNVRILAEGNIETDTAKKFVEFLANPARHRQPLPPRLTIVFDSRGGSVVGGMALGREIRRRGFDTEINESYEIVVTKPHETEVPLIEHPLCASACVMAFAGGVNRWMQPGSRLGIHQFSVPDENLGDDVTQVAVVVIAKYFEEMEVDRVLLDHASLVAASSIYWLTPEEARATFLDTTKPPRARWEVTPNADGEAVLRVVQRASVGKLVSLSWRVRDGRAILTVAVALDKALYSENGPETFPVGSAPDLGLMKEIADIQQVGSSVVFLGQPTSAWTRRETETLTIFECAVAFSTNDLRRLSHIQSIQLSSSGTPYRMGPDVKVSNEGLENGVSLLLRER